MDDTIVCPYCGHLCYDDDYDGSGENEPIEYQCPNCEKFFQYTFWTTTYYNSTQVDCLNDGNHQWIQSQYYPERIGLVRCQVCGKEVENKDLWQKLEEEKTKCVK